jgi:hypothetical protein
MADKTPYYSALRFMTSIPSWLNEYDAQRLASYNLYDDLYKNSPDMQEATLRGSDDKPIFVPTAKTIIKTLARYVAKNWSLSFAPADPAAEISDDDIAVAGAAYNLLFTRERFPSVFASAKRDGLRRGDWLFYIWGDPLKPEGSRISIKAIDPRTYFPMFADDDPDRKIGVRLAEQIVEGSDTVLKVQDFYKWNHPSHPRFGTPDAGIAREVKFLELQNWETEPKIGKTPTGYTPMPLEEIPGIHNLPVYHIRNNEEVGNPFGESDLAGLESVLAGINQAASDQDQALAMAGLGMYETDSGSPVDENDQETDWVLGPKRVVEVAEGKHFKRVSGVQSIEPSLGHINFLREAAYETNGVNDVSLGRVDTAVAESGIALELRMGPLMDAAAEKDLAITDVMNHMLFDLRDWFTTYEGITLNATAVWNNGEKIPRDKKAELERHHKLYLDGVLPVEAYVDILNSEYGYNLSVSQMAGMEQPGEMTDRLEQEAGGAEEV